MKSTPRVLIDCDPGFDDTLAILAALGSTSLHVDLITTVAGNVDIEAATSNALNLLHLVGRPDIPVYRGASQPLTKSPAPANSTYADLARGELPPPIGNTGPSGSADAAMHSWCNDPIKESKLIIAIGPMTNLGNLLQADSTALEGVTAIYAMGGTLSQQTTRISPTAEFNFFSDPDAVDLVLRSGCPLYLVDYDATSACQIPVEAIPEIAAAAGKNLERYVSSWLSHLYEHANKPFGRDGIAIHDLYAVALAAGVKPGEWLDVHLTIDCTEEGRGTLSSSEARTSGSHKVARGLDVDAILDFVMSSFRQVAASLR